MCIQTNKDYTPYYILLFFNTTSKKYFILYIVKMFFSERDILITIKRLSVCTHTCKKIICILYFSRYKRK